MSHLKDDEWAINEYKTLMNKEMKKHPNGCTEVFLNRIDEIIFLRIVEDIRKQNPEICEDVLKNFNENRQNIFKELNFDNELRLANQEERIRQLEQECPKQDPVVDEKPPKRPKESQKIKKTHVPSSSSATSNKDYNAKEVVADVLAGVQVVAGICSVLFPGKDPQTLETEMERFKKDVQKIVNQKFTGWNTDATFLTTKNYYHCCIFYDQGITSTDVTLYFRKDGEQMNKHRESYFYAHKAYRLEGVLKENLKDSSDINKTWQEAVERYQ